MFHDGVFGYVVVLDCCLGFGECRPWSWVVNSFSVDSSTAVCVGGLVSFFLGYVQAAFHLVGNLVVIGLLYCVYYVPSLSSSHEAFLRSLLFWWHLLCLCRSSPLYVILKLSLTVLDPCSTLMLRSPCKASCQVVSFVML